MSQTASRQETPERLVAELDDADARSLAALPVDEELAALMIGAFPEDRRNWLSEQGVVEGADDELRLTDRGRRVLELARERCPEPFEQIDLEALLHRTQQTIERMLEGSDVKVSEAGFHSPRPTLTDRLAVKVGIVRHHERGSEQPRSRPA